MTKCLKCGGTEIAKGKLRRSSEELFSDIIFSPDAPIRFLALTFSRGTTLEPESYACLNCGTVWSQTDPSALRDFIRKHCKGSSNEKPTV